jgi:triosephosphate isomerase (TIM)
MKPHRKALIAGNWKMNGSMASNDALMRGISDGWQALGQGACPVDVLVCPPGPFLMQIAAMSAGNAEFLAIKMGAQDVSAHGSGAYTGEVSASMLKELGCTHAIVGHSERRQYHAEAPHVVAAKARALLDQGLVPIVCLGESLIDREAGNTEIVVRGQLGVVLASLGADAARAVYAYEPIWAIGTGITATPEQAQQVHGMIRAQLNAHLHQAGAGDAAEHVTILYGGSMNAANAASLLEQPDIDGGLIGGAALKAPDFVSIIATAARLARG